MELENKLMEENQFDFDLGQELVKESMQQQQPCSRSANDMVFTNVDELNEFLACNTAMEFEEPDTENLIEKDPTNIEPEMRPKMGKMFENEPEPEPEPKLIVEIDKLLEKDPMHRPEMKLKIENLPKNDESESEPEPENEPEPGPEPKIDKLLEKDPMDKPEMRPKIELGYDPKAEPGPNTEKFDLEAKPGPNAEDDPEPKMELDNDEDGGKQWKIQESAPMLPRNCSSPKPRFAPPLTGCSSSQISRADMLETFSSSVKMLESFSSSAEMPLTSSSCSKESTLRAEKIEIFSSCRQNAGALPLARMNSAEEDSNEKTCRSSGQIARAGKLETFNSSNQNARDALPASNFARMSSAEDENEKKKSIYLYSLAENKYCPNFLCSAVKFIKTDEYCFRKIFYNLCF